VKRLLPLLALLVLASPAAGTRGGGAPRQVVLVTAETLNQLLALDQPSGKVLRRLHLPADPENVDAFPGVRTAVVVSSRGRAVSLVDMRRLRVARVLRRFRFPHIAAITPTGRYAYVTDDASGKLNVIDLRRRRLVRRVFVGSGAHHLGISPDGRSTWVALGEHARSIVVLNTSRPKRPRVVGRVDPRGLAHDLAFTPSGARVWVTHSDSSTVAVFSARSHRLLKTLSVGSPPQHVAFARAVRGARGYVTSGYTGSMQVRDARTGRLLRTVRTAYGSFNLGLGINLVATSSLMRGTLTQLDLRGRSLGRRQVAPAARDVALAFR
jgi:DNA-binding beta-propeller fold protein YncE